MIAGFQSLKTIIASVYRTLGINNEIPEVDMIEWAAESLSMIGAYAQYENTSSCIELKNGKGKLPIGFFKLADINYKGESMHWATNSNANNYQCSECQIPICKSNPTTGLSLVGVDIFDDSCENTFYLNDSYIVTNIKDDGASVCMVYLGVKLDDEGYPMIPDNIYYTKAVESYIIHKVDYQEWRKGKLTDKVYQESEKNWLFYVNSARGSANMPNVAMLENFKNIMTRLMPMRQEYKKGFKNMTNPENLNI
jgi:hypothetical protein